MAGRWRLVAAVAGGALAAGLAFLVLYWAAVATQAQHFFGFEAGGGNGSHYLFWSGSGSDLGELSIVIAIFSLLYAMLRKHNCEVHGCWRIGRHDTAAGHTVCRRHHPDGNLTAEQVVIAHNAALAEQAGC
jgi:hypothetical protein